jgi:WD40 repeat protein
MRFGVLILSLLVLMTTSVGGQDSSAKPQLVLDAGGHTAAVNKVRFLGNDHLLSVSDDKTVRLWSVRTGETLDVLRLPIGSGRSGALYALALSPDGRMLAVGGYESDGNNHGIFLINLHDRRIIEVLRGHTNVIIDLAFSRNSRWLASASADKTARVWDLESYRCHSTLRGHRDGVYAVAFSPDGQSLATASLDKTARVWRVLSKEEAIVLRGHEAPLQAGDWSRDGQRLATGSVDQAIYLWTPQGQLIHRIEKLGNHVTSVRFSNDSHGLFFTLGGGGTRDGGFLIDLATHQRRLSCLGHENSVLSGDLSRDGSLAATADANGEIFLWRVVDGRLLHRLGSQSSRPWSVAWCGTSDTMAWGTASGYVDANRRGPLESAFQLRSLEFLPLDAAHLQSARTRGRQVRLQADDARTVLARFPHGQETPLKLPSRFDQVRCYTLLDETTVAVGSDFGLTLFDIDSARPTRQLVGHQGTVWAVAPSPDGRYLLSAADDQTLRLWNWR